MNRAGHNERCTLRAAILMATFVFCVALVVRPAIALAQQGGANPSKQTSQQSDGDAEASASEDDGRADESSQEEDADDDESADDEDSAFSEEELFEGEEEETRRSDQFDTFERRRVDRKPLSAMSVEEAREAGFVFGSEREKNSRTSATLMATTAGLLVHGAGHWAMEEQRTAGILLATELVGLSLVGSAFGWQALSNNSPASRIYAGPAMFAGAGLFAVSYMADIMGTVQSVELGLPQNELGQRGVSGSAEYSFIRLDGYPGSTLQLLTVGASADLGYGYLEVETAQDVYLDTSKYGADLAWRFWRGPGRHNFVFLETSGDMLQFRGVGPFTRYGFAAKLGISFDVGMMISQLRHLVVGTSIGWGRHWYQLPDEGDDQVGGAYASDYIPYEMFMSLNFNDKLNARFSYERRDGAFLQSDSRLLGMVAAQLTFQTGDRVDLILRGEAGGGYGLTAGLRVWFWE